MGMNNKFRNGGSYSHTRTGSIIKVEIKDETMRTVYRNKFNIHDKNSIMNLLGMLEKFGNFSVYDLVNQKIKSGEWW